MAQGETRILHHLVRTRSQPQAQHWHEQPRRSGNVLRGMAPTQRASHWPRDPAKTLVTDLLTDYLSERGPKVSAESRIAYALVPLIDFFEGCAVIEVSPETCERYTEWRSRSAGTVRRELGVLRAAINHAHKRGRLTRSVAVDLPDRPPSRDRWLTRQRGGKAAKSGTHSASTPLHAALHTRRSLHRKTQRSDTIPPMATS
jgi:hypothetical protein